MNGWTDNDISALVQQIDDLEVELEVVVRINPNYHLWHFDDGAWKCRFCSAVRVCQESPEQGQEIGK